MKKHYLPALVLLALIFATFSVVSAQTDLRSTREIQKAALETQREKLKTEAGARKKAAEVKGDEVQAKREAKILEVEAKRVEADTKREAKRVEAETKRTEMQAKRVDFQQGIAKRKVEQTAKVILATIERLEKIIVRLESRIAKVQARGGVTTESEGFVAAVRLNLSDARIAVGTFTGIDLSSEKAADNFERIRIAAAGAREYIRTAHTNLMMAVRALKGPDTGTVTSTSDSDD